MKSKEFEFKEIDVEGMDTLDAVAEADSFNEWMYETINRFTEGKILEIGSGIGNISEYFIKNKQDIVLSDIRTNYRDQLQRKFPSVEVVDMDIVDENFDTKFADKFKSYDTIFALNVVEHIKDDKLALENCYKLLKPKGKLIILVPAYQALYNNFDKALEHYRRYNKKTLSEIFPKEFKLIHSKYFNFAGIFGWFVTGKLMGKEVIPKGQMSLYNKLVPIFKIADKIMLNNIGLSVIVVGEKH